MLVSDVMSKQVEYVTPRTSIKDVCSLIFGRGINGVPVVDKKKVIGFITERDILSKFYPSEEEYIEDPLREGNFEEMEDKAAEIFRMRAAKIMSTTITTVTPQTPLLRAQSLMLINKVGRLPVVDSEGNLVGILSKGDIFRSIVGKKIPFEEEEGFYDWLAKDYDKLNDWKIRLKGEIPDIVRLFKEQKVKNVIDVAASTGEHSIALARKGFKVFGIDTSPSMYRIAKVKKEGLSKKIKRRIEFLTGNYGEIIQKLPDNLDAAIFMGNAFPHVFHTDKNILINISKILKPKGSVIIFQMINFEKILKINKGFRDYKLLQSKDPYREKQIYFGFYTKEKNSMLTITRTVFDYELGKWVFRRINSTPVLNIGRKEIALLLKKAGFKKISFYGSKFYGNILEGEFKQFESDWLNVVAVR